ncbi:MAG TPA: serine hydrolase domain-containing protein [Bacteroidales bacterium]|jgi:CubicO group peptidase (beta-lactamase class C family)|nr:serine hydrolase domain-containing protein [Bacteroidales bacterium]HPB89090.1 serine hydrolase domain-containing protein [Bacteroidales bacterium]HPH52490.1 serine hydrolase domain-containing protein [Bacteroidales bacterium]HPY22208.1 serine hydrolase domain-containing protein [Bacteroidales bacterium]HQA93356.1 serine hydrolase domain-containing protein [Bacteroidales bacterium]
MKRIVIILILSAVFTTCCAPKASVEELNQIVSEFYQDVKSANIPVFQYCIFEKDISIGGVILADSVYNYTQPANDSSIFQAASLSKPLFAYIVMKMVDKGEIDLDTPICQYTDIERFEDKEMAAILTPRMVLSHTTGLPNWSAKSSSDEWPTSVIKFKYPADSCFSYSGEGFAYLQRAIEAIRGTSLDVIAREEVFVPLRMNSTSFGWLPQYDSIALDGFNRAAKNRGQGRHPRENSAYTLRTNASEYMRFLIAVMEGKGLSATSHAEMLTPQSHAIRYADHPDCDSTIRWTIGLGAIYSDTAAVEKGEAPRYYYHLGDNGNFKALFVFRPEDRRGIVYFTNSVNGHEIITSVTRATFGELLSIQDWLQKTKGIKMNSVSN